MAEALKLAPVGPETESLEEDYRLVLQAIAEWEDSDEVLVATSGIRRAMKACRAIEEVVDEATYEAAMLAVRGKRVAQKELEAWFKPRKAAPHSLWKAVVAIENRALDGAKEEDVRLVREATGWKREQERLAREAEAERRRVEAEARRAEEAKARAAEEERQRAAASGEEPNLPMEEPEPLPVEPVIAPAPVPKVKGSSTRKTWKAEITDLGAFVGAIAQGKVPLNLVLNIETWPGQPNSYRSKHLDRQANDLQGQLGYAGVSCYESDSVSFR